MNLPPTALLVALALCVPSLVARADAEPDGDPKAAPRADAAKLATIPERMKEFVAKKEVAGVVTLVAARDKVLHLEAVGRADVARGTPMKPDTIFWIASMTKPITAVAVLMLQDEGKLSVQDPVGKYIPELAGLKTADGKPADLTLKHLLTHTSGLGEATGEQSRAARTLADLIPHYAKQPVKFEPGSQWAYSQSGINSLGRIVEVVSGMPFAEFLEQRLFGPLGMKDTTFYPTRSQLERSATPYLLDGGNLKATVVTLLNADDPANRDRVPLANGGLFSTAADYGRFCQVLLNGGSLGGKQYLKPETVKLMTRLHTGELSTGFTPGNGWGLGVIVVRSPQGVSEMLSPGSFGHGGTYGTQAWVDPVRGVAYVLMVQRANFPNADNSDVRRTFQEAAAGAFER